MRKFNQEEFNKFIEENNVYGFFEEPITLVSGRKSHFYVNWRDITKDVWLADKLIDYIIAFAQDNQIEADTFYGVPEGATKLGLLTQYKWAKMSGSYAPGSHALAMGRAKIKDHGLPKDKFFVGMPNGKVVIVEDLVTVATNLMPVIDNLRSAGVDVVGVIVLANRMEKRDDGISVKEAVEAKGVRFFSMSSALDILPIMYKKLQSGEEIGRKVEDYYKQYGIKRIKLVKPKFLGKEISGIFTIPSGLITTDAKVIEKIANEIPEIGVITTKSIGLESREGNKEPIFTQYAPGSFINAVGLTNLGAKEFARQLSKIKIPEDKFLLVSIFGKDAKEFVEVAKILEPYADGLELNLSCPHAEGYGMAIGQDPLLVKEITMAVKKAVAIPVIPKLTPNVNNIVEIAKAVAEGGADAVCAVNTVGPGYYAVDGNPVLSNEKGGLSGKAILPIGLKCVKEISEAVKLPIIGCGGISGADDIRSYQKMSAVIFGIGSALVGLSSKELAEYFSALENDLEIGENKAEKILRRDVNMKFTKYRLIESKKIADDLSLLVFDGNIKIKPGQFIFVWIPGVGEKPFSVLDNQPLTLAVQKRGCFSEKLISLEAGAEIYFRGPYGAPLKINPKSKLVLVGGGTGLAALYQIAKNFKNTEIFIGAKDRRHLFYIDKLRAFSKVHLTTDDGSEGFGGFVTDLLEKKLSGAYGDDTIFFNCGPEVMVNAAERIEKEFVPASRIYSSIDYLTKCGVGICGSCATKDGQRLCVDGPFIGENEK